MAQIKIQQGNDFVLNIICMKYVDATTTEAFDLSASSNVSVNLYCEAHDEYITINDWTLADGTTNVIQANIAGASLHAGTKYGLVITGIDEDGENFKTRIRGRNFLYVVSSVNDLTEKDFITNPLNISIVMNMTGELKPIVFDDLATYEYVDEAVSGVYIYVDQSVNDLAPKAYVDAAVSGLASISYVDASVSGLATEDYVDQSVSGLATEVYVDEKIASITGIEGQVTQQYVDNAISGAYRHTDDAISGAYKHTDDAVTGLASKDYVDQSITGLASKDYVDQSITGLATEDYVDNAVSGLATEGYVDQSVSGLATEDYVDNAVSGLATEGYVDNAVSGLATSQEVEQAVSGLASEDYVDNAVSGLATEGYVDNAVTGLATITYVDEAVSGAGGVSQQYVDDAVSGCLEDANNYTDTSVSSLTKPYDNLPYEEQYLTVETSNGIVYNMLTITLSGDAINNVQYSFDRQTWTTMSGSGNIQYSSYNKKIYFRGTLSESSNYGINIKSTNTNYSHIVYGNILSLIYGDDFKYKYLKYASSGLKNLFNGFTRLTSAKNLIIPENKNNCAYCYQGIFNGCSSLVEAPEKIIVSGYATCYQMFKDCSSLTKSPLLTGDVGSFNIEQMFNGCTSLTIVNTTFNGGLSSSTSSNWLNNVASSGILVLKDGYTNPPSGADGLPTSWTLLHTSEYEYAHKYELAQAVSGLATTDYVDQAVSGAGGGVSQQYVDDAVSGCLEDAKEYTDAAITKTYEEQYLTFEAVTGGTISIMASDASVSKTISYSTDDGSTWTELTTSTTEQSFGTFEIGDKLLVKGNNDSYFANNQRTNFKGTAKVKIYGNIMSLIYGDNFKGKTTFASGTTYNFFNLFGQIQVVDAENLILPATVLTNNCYSQMFSDCKLLETAPELPATTLAENCYGRMFENCWKLNKAPKILPATTLTQYCYWKMFYMCKLLTKAPELPATTLVNYSYHDIFNGCEKLNYVKALFTSTPQYNYTYGWLNGVSPTGTFIKGDNATWDVVGGYGTPVGWNVYTESEYDYARNYQTQEKLGTVEAVSGTNINLYLNDYTNPKHINVSGALADASTITLTGANSGDYAINTVMFSTDASFSSLTINNAISGTINYIGNDFTSLTGSKTYEAMFERRGSNILISYAELS